MTYWNGIFCALVHISCSIFPPQNEERPFKTVTAMTGAHMFELNEFMTNNNVSIKTEPLNDQETLGGMVAAGSHVIASSFPTGLPGLKVSGINHMTWSYKQRRLGYKLEIYFLFVALLWAARSPSFPLIKNYLEENRFYRTHFHF